MERWKKSICALAKKNQRTAEEIKQVISQNDKTNIQVRELESDTSILAVNKDGYHWNLNSRLDPEGAADLYVKRYQIKPFYRYFIFGFSDGRVIRKLLEQCDESNLLLIYEPDKKILAEAMKQYDLEDVFSNSRVWVEIPETWEELIEIVARMVEFSYVRLIEFCILPVYDILYPEKCKMYINEVVERIHYEMVQMQTSDNFNRELPMNAMFHMKNMIVQRNCVQIKKILSDIEIHDIPAIIIAAGPSLDKNIHRIKSAQGRAFIFVVDAALRTVIREGICPDLVCTIDPRAPERFFETMGEQEFLWACSYWTNPWPIRKNERKVFYYNSLMQWWDEALQKEMSDTLPRMESGGSVSTEAFQLARYFGFRTIIFIGQDLAFTGGQSHTKGIGDVLGDNDAYISRRHIVPVEDVDGNLLDTDFQMDYYRRWIERQIEKEENDFRVIDATEGGAKIKGTIIQPLKETIEQECKREVNIHKKIEEIPPVFNETQQERLYNKIDELENLKNKFCELVEKGIELEKELMKECSRLNNNQIAEKLKRITRQNEKIEQHPFVNWVGFYASKGERELKENICAKEDMDIPEIMERSIRLMESYQAAVPLFEADFEAIFRKEQQE